MRRSRSAPELLSAVEQLRGDHTGYEERAENEPVDWICDDERSIWRKEKQIEAEKGQHGQRQPERTAPLRARQLHDEQVNERHVNASDPLAHDEHHRRDGRKDDEPGDPSLPARGRCTNRRQTSRHGSD